MNCPACKNEVNQAQRCPICDFDIDLYRKIKSISNRLYNQGLEQAKNRELTAAIDSLNKAIEFDKSNVEARNLLGLVYFEMGQVGQALTEWVISTHFKKEENIANDFINQIQANPRKLEMYNDSIRMYNQAIEYIKQRSEDLAIIQLKKAIQQSPNLVEAYCLLALCYIAQKDKTKALSYIEKVLEIDISNPKAIRYQNELKSSLRPQVNERTRTVGKHEPKRRNATYFSPLGQIVGFIVGAICTAALLFILVIPDKTNHLNKQISDLNVENQRLEEELAKATRESQETISTLEEEIAKIQATNDELQQKQNAIEEAQKINQVETLYKNNNVSEAASLLMSIDLEILPGDSKAAYNALADKVFKEAGRYHYNIGLSDYSKGDYNNARINFEKSFLYVKDQYYSDNVLYYLGRIYEAENNIEKAKEVYQQAIDQYKGTDGANSSRRRLNNLQ
ncbi:MAG: tetratricopeptide repeat protein [Epulopiscium sp.]|nr:tetratricopeptide repeat protein [Candidatus Epulonipiscium sp.]